MTIYLTDWRERDLDRQAARQRNQIETAKLIATFSVSAAAAIAAGAFQEVRSRVWDVVCIVLLAVAFVLVLVVVALDRTITVSHDSMIADARQRRWGDERLLLELNIALVVAVRNNEQVASTVRRVTFVQVTFALLAAVAGTISLLSH